MSVRGMIMQERTSEALATALCDEFARLPRATWVSAEELADGMPGLESCGDGRYEVVALGATVSADEVFDAACKAAGHAQQLGLSIDHDRARGFRVASAHTLAS